MRRSDEAAAFLFKRKSRYYFRYCLPELLQAALGRCEIRVSLETRDPTVARERAAVGLPYVYALKRLCRRMKDLTPEEFKSALTFAVTQLIEKLERTKEPWQRSYSLPGPESELRIVDTGLGTVLALNGDAIPFNDAGNLIWQSEPSHALIKAIRKNIAANKYSEGTDAARDVLAKLDIRIDENSTEFQQFSLEMLKLKLMSETVRQARAYGDYKTEQNFIDGYTRTGHFTPVLAPTGPTISEAWAEFVAEKKDARTHSAWAKRTAHSYAAAFAEFKEIVGDIRVNQVTREVMLQYRKTLVRLPKNRTKGDYRDKSIAELLAMEIPREWIPAEKTVKDKLVSIATFLKWCRKTKKYLTDDPMADVHLGGKKVKSKSYAAFTRTDLEKLFYSAEYTNGEHSQSWHFWIPLVALYTGARQSEIAQLTVENVVKEDGVWTFGITDSGEDQSIKTDAGIRIVPVSSKLIALGLLDYKDFVKKRGDARLFPDIPKGNRGPGDKVSRWFGDTYKRKCGIKPDATGKRKVFHSFRTTAMNKIARETPLLLPYCQQVFGHEPSLLGQTATYIGELPVVTLVPVIEALDYGLDHSAYKDSWRKYVEKW